jgi:hypothetical protein
MHREEEVVEEVYAIHYDAPQGTVSQCQKDKSGRNITTATTTTTTEAWMVLRARQMLCVQF